MRCGKSVDESNDDVFDLNGVEIDVRFGDERERELTLTSGANSAHEFKNALKVAK